MNNLYKFLLSIFTLSLLVACARIGTPPGGPIDEDPPVVVKSKPENYSTNYKRKNVYIEFDEYVTLESAYTEFTISPPIEKTPIPRLKGKGVLVELPPALLDTFTYTLDFGQAIVDNNEKNPLPNFQFVISKQTHIDSFSISGIIKDAFTHLPDEEGLFVHLYSNLSDTIPYTTPPSYLGKSNSEGEFRINHIAPGTYAVFALKDANANMLFDMPSEVIAFTSEPVYLYPDSFPAIPDTILEQAIFEDEHNHSTLSEDTLLPANEPVTFSTSEDTLIIDIAEAQLDSTINDSTKTDSIEFMVYGYSFNLYSFTEPEIIKKYLVEYNRNEPEKFEIIFNGSYDTIPEITLLYPDTIGDWYLLESNSTLDTLVYWLPDSNLIKTDSLVVALNYLETDTNNIDIIVTDTLLFQSKSKKDKKSDKKRKGGLGLGIGKKNDVVDTLPKPKPRVNFKHNINTGGHDLYRPIEFTIAAPTFEYKPDLIELFRLEDSLEFPAKFDFYYDSSQIRKSTINVDFEPNSKYILRLHEGIFTDIYNRTIDSTEISFTTQRDDFYGIIEVSMLNVQSPIILQLLKTDKSVVEQSVVYADKKAVFDFLYPGKYKLKIIYDDNDNGEWDTGEYKLQLQPERVAYFPDEFEVKSNWTTEYEWEIEY